MRSSSKVGSIQGWFPWLDQLMFRSVLESQTDPGTLVELGCYLGKSAVLIGDYVRPGEEFIVVDLFGRMDLVAGDQSATAEADLYAHRLSQQQFEDNYLSVHPELPTVIVGFSSEIVDHVAPGTARFIHVDASHQYEHVVEDIASAVRLIRPGGVIVFDDFRSVHTPGVGAAVWGAVERGEIIPVAHTDQKMYCVTSEPAELRSCTERVIAASDIAGQEHQVAGHPVLRVLYSAAHAARKAEEKEAAERRAAEDHEARFAESAGRDAYAAEWARRTYGVEAGMSPARLAARLLARGYLPKSASRLLVAAKRRRRG